MAKEIQSNITVNIAGKGGSKSAGAAALTEDAAGGGGTGFKINIGIASEPIAIGADIGVPKLVFIQNMDPLHFVEIDNVTTMDSAAKQKLVPGAGILIRPSAAPTLFGKADPAATSGVAIWVVAG